MKKIISGDIFEISTPAGLAYLHYIGSDSSGVECVRVLSGLFKTQPANLEEVVNQKHRFFAQFPVKVALRNKMIKLVGHYDGDFQLPSFARSIRFLPGKELGWHIVNTETLQRRFVQELTPDERQLSSFGVYSYPDLVEHIANDWSPETWELPTLAELNEVVRQIQLEAKLRDEAKSRRK